MAFLGGTYPPMSEWVVAKAPMCRCTYSLGGSRLLMSRGCDGVRVRARSGDAEEADESAKDPESHVLD